MASLNKTSLSLFLLGIYLSISCVDATKRLQPRIVGGKDAAEKGQFPYMVTFVNSKKNIIACGGAIVNEQYILSSASCLKMYLSRLDDLFVVLGAWKADEREFITKVAAIEMHPSFSVRLSGNDIAMVKTTDKIVFNEFIHPIALPMNDVKDGDVDVIITGFGATFVST